MKKIKLGLMITVISVSMLLFAAQVATATVATGGASGSPQTGSSGGSTSGSTSGTTSGTTGKTGAEVVLFAAVGAGLLGTGYLLTRKSRA